MNFKKTKKFDKDLKISKKYSTLENDLETTLKKVLRLNPKENPPFSYRIAGLGEDFASETIIKVKAIACRSIKGKGKKSGLRLIYHYEPTTNTITFLELYHKSKKENENKKRILNYLKQLRK